MGKIEGARVGFVAFCMLRCLCERADPGGYQVEINEASAVLSDAGISRLKQGQMLWRYWDELWYTEDKMYTVQDGKH